MNASQKEKCWFKDNGCIIDWEIIGGTTSPLSNNFRVTIYVDVGYGYKGEQSVTEETKGRSANDTLMSLQVKTEKLLEEYKKSL